MENEEIREIYSEMLPDVRPVSPLDTPYRYLCLFLPKDLDSSILDAGCGNGQYALKLAQEGYTRIDAVDLFTAIDTKGAFNYRRGSVDDLEFGDGVFDLVYSFSVVYYLEDARDAFREYFRVMKPGATLVMSAHTKYSPHTWDRKVRMFFGGAKHLNEVKFRTSNRYADFLEECGFEVENMWGYGLSYPRANPLAKIKRRVLTKRNPGGIRRALQRPQWMQSLVSNVAYHSLLAARKPVES